MTAFEVTGKALQEAAPNLARVFEETAQHFAPGLLRGGAKVTADEVSSVISGLEKGGFHIRTPQSELAAYTATGQNGESLRSLVSRNGAPLEFSPVGRDKIKATAYGLSVTNDGKAIGTNFHGVGSWDPAIALMSDSDLRLSTSMRGSEVVSFYGKDSLKYVPALESKGMLPIYAGEQFHQVPGRGLVSNYAKSITLQGPKAWLAEAGSQVQVEGLVWPTEKAVTVTL
jgi:hypothetical protein